MNNVTISTSAEPPIACSLSAAEYRRRVEDTGRVAQDALRGRHPITGGARLTFDDAPGVRARLERFVAAESRCCPFLTLDLNADDGALVLDVTSPADAAPIIEELFA
jgi:hypothetical protein